jgi:voltage-gated potassium channel Kch
MVKRVEHRGMRPRDAAIIVSGFWAAAVIVFGIVERAVDPKSFHSVWLGMWWAVETVTTVGYGDIVPSQTAGKVIAGFLMLGGLSLISVLTAVITSGFVALAQERRRAEGEDPIGQKLDEIATEVRAVGARLDRLVPPSDPEDAGSADHS